MWKHFSLVFALISPLVSQGPVGAAEHFVDVRPNNQFVPRDLVIEAGDRVTWRNLGGTHNVVADDLSFRCAEGCDGNGGNGDPSPGGWQVSLDFDTPGTIPYGCEFHVTLGMTGTITVLPSATDIPGTLQFSQANLTISEGVESLAVTVTRTRGDDGPVSVDYQTSDGSATAGMDYVAANGTLSWADNDDDPKSFNILLIDDNVDENNETVNLMLSNPTGGAALGARGAATLRIIDNDNGGPPPPPPPPPPTPPPPPPTGLCVADATTLCLGEDGRFQVRVTWGDFNGNVGDGIAIDIGRHDSGLFYFFSESNVEMLIKVLDACRRPSNKFWVLFAATTNVEFRVEVNDLVAGVGKVYTNALGKPAVAEIDTRAFDTCSDEP